MVQCGREAGDWNGGEESISISDSSLNFLANSDDLISLEFFFLCSAFFDLCPFLSVLVSTEMWVTDLSPSYCKSLTHMLPPQGIGFTGEKWEK